MDILQVEHLDDSKGLSGLLIKQLFNAGTIWVKEHITELNGIDIFPTPSGNAGIQIYRTLRSGCINMSKCSGISVESIVASAAHGALIGARGHQGVPFSQWLRGIVVSLNGKQSVSVQDFAQALAEAAKYAYMAEIRPIEGTMCTVAREASEVVSARNLRISC
ncbi:MAG TPA: DAK2 domain-containing protein [Ktedonobacteraceae bacterium]|nr:DAK2 domain-containing protein [Ktedonobacteraceae bacterium]